MAAANSTREVLETLLKSIPGWIEQLEAIQSDFTRALDDGAGPSERDDRFQKVPTPSRSNPENEAGRQVNRGLFKLQSSRVRHEATETVEYRAARKKIDALAKELVSMSPVL